MDSHERRIVEFLSTRRAYPHPAGRIARRETHVSHVFLAGNFAYKLKKPVRFPFLDASTLVRRKRFCQLELALNRRLAPAIYLSTVPVTEEAGTLKLGGRGRAVEWLVRMRRLPEARMLDRLVASGSVRRKEATEIAERLISFFRKAARSRRIDFYGRPAQVAALLLGNLQECLRFIGAVLTEPDRQRIEAAYRQWLALHEPLLARRLREGRIIDGHGDLRCENICLTKPVSIFDCVEFQPAFRCGDVANDFSFLVMDLEFRGREDLAAILARCYRRLVRDPTFDAVLPVYQCHRTLVRGKVRGFAWLQHPRSRSGQQVRALARRHFRLAGRYVRQFAPPRLVVIGGAIGTGKSTLAGSLAKAMGLVWLRTDQIRRQEFAHLRGRGQGFEQGLYAPRVSELVYQRLISQAEVVVREGRSVICDGTFSRASGRRALRAIARRHGASFHYVECVTLRGVALQRAARRAAAGGDWSEARPEHYGPLKAGYEPVRGWSAREWTRLSTAGSPTATHQHALAALRRAWRIPS